MSDILSKCLINIVVVIVIILVVELVIVEVVVIVLQLPLLIVVAAAVVAVVVVAAVVVEIVVIVSCNLMLQRLSCHKYKNFSTCKPSNKRNTQQAKYFVVKCLQ